MRVEFDLRGDVVERQELLNGTQSVTLNGASADGAWLAIVTFSWNRGLAEFAADGDITLSRADGAECFGTLAAADIGDADESGGGRPLRLTYDIDGGAGALDGAGGSASLAGSFDDGTFRASCSIDLSPAA